MRYRTVLFDLDGTLLDSQYGILSCLKSTLFYFGIERELSELYQYLGPPIQDTFYDFFQDEEQISKAILEYRRRYRETGIYDAKIYPYVEELLIALNHAGVTCKVATSKPALMAEKALQHFALAQYFDEICGVPMEQNTKTKADVIRKALQGENLSDVVMVGDRKFDLIGAEQCGIDAIGVLYGYGTVEELNAYPHKILCADTRDLRTYLLQVEE